MKAHMIRLLLWAAVLGLMALIFAFSAQHGVESDQMTVEAAMPIAELIASMQEGADDETVILLYNIFGTVLRKLAHLCEYALLGLLLHLLYSSYGLTMKWLPLVTGVMYAASDELHQTFVPGRLGTPTDVLIDAAGVLIGIYLITMIEHLRRKKHVHHP